MDFFNLLTGPELLEITEAHLPDHRERLYPPTVTLSMFMRQALAPIDRVSGQWMRGRQRAAEGLWVQSIRTGGYCRARQRLPLSMLQALTRESGRLLSERGLVGAGAIVREVADGTGVSMPDTPRNQVPFRSPPAKPSESVFRSHVCARICLSSGAVLAAAIGPPAAMGTANWTSRAPCCRPSRPGDVLLADALYGNYWEIAQVWPPALMSS